MKQMNAKGGRDEVHGVRQKTKSRPKQGRERETGKADKDKTHSGSGPASSAAKVTSSRRRLGVAGARNVMAETTLTPAARKARGTLYTSKAPMRARVTET